MAARFAYQNPAAVQGLALWAAYPASADDLSGHSLAVTSISGTRDGLSAEDKIAASRVSFPPDSTWVPIEGGNLSPKRLRMPLSGMHSPQVRHW
jgi:hypothetical protein